MDEAAKARRKAFRKLRRYELFIQKMVLSVDFERDELEKQLRLLNDLIKWIYEVDGTESLEVLERVIEVAGAAVEKRDAAIRRLELMARVEKEVEDAAKDV